MTTPLQLFEDRRAAGRALARALAAAHGANTLVLGIPRGGVPVAFEVAEAIGSPLDVLVSRRMYAPRGAAVIGSIAETGVVWFDETALKRARINDSDLSDCIVREAFAIDRHCRALREGRRRQSLDGRTVVLVDDGLVTGATAQAAVRAARTLGARRLILAAPVADAAAVAALEPHVDAIAALRVVPELGALSRWYGDLPPVTDGEVIALLAVARSRIEAALDAAVS